MPTPSSGSQAASVNVDLITSQLLVACLLTLATHAFWLSLSSASRLISSIAHTGDPNETEHKRDLLTEEKHRMTQAQKRVACTIPSLLFCKLLSSFHSNESILPSTLFAKLQQVLH